MLKYSLLYSMVVILFFTGCSHKQVRESYRAKVIQVHSGDTVSIATREHVQRVHLSFIDAPDIYQPYGEQAKSYLEKQVLLQDVLVVPQGKAQKLPLVELVNDETISINERMVINGYAWKSRYTPGDSLYSHLMREAQKSRNGLWSDPLAIPPWAWNRVFKGGK